MINYSIKLDKIIISNFRGFEKLEIKFGKDNYYPIVGKNGVGKTNILEAINIALSDNSSKFNNIYETDFYCDDPIELEVVFNDYFFIKFLDGGMERLIPCRSFKKTISRRRIKERNSLFSPPYEIKYSYTVLNFSPVTQEYRRLKSFIQENVARNLFLIRQLKVDPDGSLKFTIESDPQTWRDADIGFGLDKLPKILFPKVFYFDKDRSRELLEQYNTTLSKIVTELNWRHKRGFLKMDEEAQQSLNNKYADFHSEIKKVDDHKLELVDPVIEVVKNKLGIAEIGDELDFYFMDLLNPYRGSMFGHRSPQNQLVPITKYGSGISSIISLSFLIEFAKQAKECIFILIDEPEIHLHPDLSKKLKKILLESEFQSIISTHSHLFLDKVKYKNNICIDTKTRGGFYARYCNQIDLADVQFRLLGNSLDDLYVPKSILLVEGKYDKIVLSKSLDLIDLGDLKLQILDCEGYTDFPTKVDRYKKALEVINSATISKIEQDITILIDGDVEVAVVDGWKSTYSLDGEKLYHLESSDKCLEYIYPESLIKGCVNETLLKDGTKLQDKSKIEIIEIILADDKKDAEYDQETNRISKAQLNGFVAENLTLDILASGEGAELFEVLKWIASSNGRTI